MPRLIAGSEWEQVERGLAQRLRALNMFIDDPKSIRYDERAKAKLLTINGVSLADRKKATEWAKQIVEFRTKVTIEAIEKAVANKGTLPAPPRRPAGN